MTLFPKPGITHDLKMSMLLFIPPTTRYRTQRISRMSTSLIGSFVRSDTFRRGREPSLTHGGPYSATPGGVVSRGTLWHDWSAPMDYYYLARDIGLPYSHGEYESPGRGGAEHRGMSTVRRIRIVHRTAPGDTVVLTQCVKSLMVTNPGAFKVSYCGNHPELFENNPYITKLKSWEGQEVTLDYGPYLQRGSDHCRHFVESFCIDLGRRLGVNCALQNFRGDIYLSDAEKKPWRGLPKRYWLVDAGCKPDMPIKRWSAKRFQEVVDTFAGRLSFVQIGVLNEHEHPALRGVVDLRGKTTLRDLVRVMHRAEGVLTPVSLPMHLCAATPQPDGGYNRGCVVIAGHRESRSWEAYNGHCYLGADGRAPHRSHAPCPNCHQWIELSCALCPKCHERIEWPDQVERGRCVPLGGGCWRTKAVPKSNGEIVFVTPNGTVKKYPRDPNEGMCTAPRCDGAGQMIAGCLADISTPDVVEAIERFL